MDYARFTYVAQPGDGVTNLMPDIEIYDKWPVQWRYTVWPDAGPPDEEREMLNARVVDQVVDPLYFYGRQGPRVDLRSNTEDLKDDAVATSGFGIADFKIILNELHGWTAEDAKDNCAL